MEFVAGLAASRATVRTFASLEGLRQMSGKHAALIQEVACAAHVVRIT